MMWSSVKGNDINGGNGVRQCKQDLFKMHPTLYCYKQMLLLFDCEITQFSKNAVIREQM